MNAKTMLRRDVTLHVSADNKRYHGFARGVPYIRRERVESGKVNGRKAIKRNIIVSGASG
jgi:hypothetical protein